MPFEKFNPVKKNEMDEKWMRQALALAEKGRYTTTPNPCVGCVIVSAEGLCVGQGFHVRAGGAHAEIHALNQAGEAARGATAYVTLEPCSHFGRTPPCALALKKAGICRVVCAMKDPNPLVSGEGIRLLEEAGIEVECGLLEAEALALNEGFVHRMKTGIPWVILKTASTLDGKTALKNGVSQWITGEVAREAVQKGRAASCAILTGIGTVLADDPRLTVRGLSIGRQPMRCILDTHLKMPLEAQLLKEHGAVWIAYDPARVENPQKISVLKALGVQLFPCPVSESGHLAFEPIFKALGALQINTVWVEAGARLNGTLLNSGWVNAWHAYVAPMIVGECARGLFDFPELTTLAAAKRFKIVEQKQRGEDIFFKLLPLSEKR